MTLGASMCHSADEKSEESLIQQLRDYTGITDYVQLRKALQQTKAFNGAYELNDAAEWLLLNTREDSNENDEAPSSFTKARSGVPVIANKNPFKHSKLTSGGSDKLAEENNQDDLQKALAASMQEGGNNSIDDQFSAEDREMSRAIEQSLVDSKTLAHQDRMPVFFSDPVNPYERARTETWPVGLKNVGSTCWFSVVVQALFHLPAFRRYVLNFDCSNLDSKCGTSAGLCSPSTSHTGAGPTREVEFMQALRKLFGQLLASRRQYVDPTPVVELLRRHESFQSKNNEDQQQDVSEFAHILLQWLEDAFATQASAALHDTDHGDVKVVRAINPMEELFYGAWSVEKPKDALSVAADDTCQSEFRSEKFSQYLLRVEPFQNIYDSIEASLVSPTGADATVNCCDVPEERWMTALPPVMIFELSRFRYNQLDNRPEKLHQKFTFPKELYLDRFLRKNKAAVYTKRDCVQKLKARLQCLKAQLAKYENYGSSTAAPCSLPEVLRLALKFAEAPKSSKFVVPMDDVTPPSPVLEHLSNNSADENGNTGSVGNNVGSSHAGVGRTHSPMDLDCSPTDPKLCRLDNVQGSPFMPDQGLVTETPSGPGDVNANQVTSVHLQLDELATSSAAAEPCPHHVTTTELSVLQSCLGRWHDEAVRDIKGLECSIHNLEAQIESVYADMQTNKYRLHALCIHEGAATLGHYWAFIWDDHAQTWRKYNDVRVTEVPWSDIERDAIGGYHNACAYCLIYVDANRKDLFEEKPEIVQGKLDVLPQMLPSDLASFVSKDNELFLNELAMWDLDHAAAPTPGSPGAATPNRAMPSCPPVSPAQQPMSPATPITPQRIDKSAFAAPVVGITPEQIQGHITLGKRICECVLSKVRTLTLPSDGDPTWLFREALVEETRLVQLEVQAFLAGSVCYNPFNDRRLASFLTYCFALNWEKSPCLTPSLRTHLLAEQFQNPYLLQFTCGDELIAAAKAEMETVSLQPEDNKTYLTLHRLFNKFRETAVLVTVAIEHFNNKSYEECLKHVLCAETYNEDLLKATGNSLASCIHPTILRLFKGYSMTKLSECVRDAFLTGDDQHADNQLRAFQSFVLPQMKRFSRSASSEDNQIVSYIVAQWYDLLSVTDTLSDAKRNWLQDLLPSLTDVGDILISDMRLNAKIRLSYDLADRYIRALNRAKDEGLLCIDNFVFSKAASQYAEAGVDLP